MSKQYYRRKKCRALKRTADIFSDSDDNFIEKKKKENSSENHNIEVTNPPILCQEQVNLQTDENSLITEDAVTSTIEVNQFTSPCHQDDGQSSLNSSTVDDSWELEVTSSVHESEVSPTLPTQQIGMREKLRAWALKNMESLRLTVVSELLVLLRSEGYVSLPKTAQSLLGTVHCRRVQPMTSRRGTAGEYLYLGIQESLARRIFSNIYVEDTIRILVHIDGVQVYKNSRKQFWPILVTLYDKKYISHPFIAAIYSGDSKPKSAFDFMHDFVTEAAHLIKDGIFVDNKKYNFEIKAIVADSPARSFIKCTKSHNGFYACERCETKGVTINKKRVYPEIDSKKRTWKSFKKQRQSQHHLTDLISPLVELPKFNPIKSMVLDSMHLLFLGAQKFLLEKWINRNSASRITIAQLKLFRELMSALTPDIPDEFQRRVFDIDDLAHWKATQFRFMLLYCSPLVLRHVLPPDYYEHFLLLFVACRILCDSQLAVARADYADQLLRKFFFLLPSFYGNDSQVLNMHNLIHISQDVKNMQASLSDFSAFWGENYIGKLKKLVRSQKNPLVQVVNRLSEIESSDTVQTQRRREITELLLENDSEVEEYQQRKFKAVRRVCLKETSLSAIHPNNTVVLNDGAIFRISRILVEEHIAPNPKCASEIYLQGCQMNKEHGRSVFNNPLSSEDIGVVRTKNFSHDLRMRRADEIERKIVLLTVKNKKYSVSLLHV